MQSDRTGALRRLVEDIVPEDRVLCDWPMARETTFRCGGPADIFVRVADEKELVALLRALKAAGAPWFLMGNGSNLLVRDGGLRGVVLQIGPAFGGTQVQGDTLRARAGTLLSQAARAAADKALTGLEFAAGIPGTVGGGVFMNAGAYGGELKDVLHSVRVLNPESGEIYTLAAEQMQMGYRHSRLGETGEIALEAAFKLAPGQQASILARMEELNARRRDKQPLEKGSAGSTFKRPEGYFAGALIEQAGLKGFSIGPAQVSPKHAGFVVNNGGASAAQVLSVIEEVRRRVLENAGVALQCEVRIVGEDA